MFDFDLTLNLSIDSITAFWSFEGTCMHLYILTKGQLISKYSFGVFKSSKKTNDIFSRISALASKNRSNQKNKDTL